MLRMKFEGAIPWGMGNRRVSAKKPIYYWLATQLKEAFLIKSGWFFLIAFLSLFLFHKAHRYQIVELKGLQKEIHLLSKTKEVALKEQQELKRQIQSQTDPNWVELVLKKELGLVGEKEQKVHFIKA